MSYWSKFSSLLTGKNIEQVHKLPIKTVIGYALEKNYTKLLLVGTVVLYSLLVDGSILSFIGV